MPLLSEPYYSACNEVFRRSTNQARLMLKEMERLCAHQQHLSILSVGSGAGLFEIPMLKMLQDGDVQIGQFVGVDISTHACLVLAERMEAEFASGMAYKIVCSPFEDFTTNQDFDIVLHNHAFEYLRGSPGPWLRASQDMLTPDGNVVIFSPDRGGINGIYEELAHEPGGWSPIFADDIEASLKSEGTRFKKKTLAGECDITLLWESDSHPDKIKLLSFLTQRDCTEAPLDERERYIEYFLSLRQTGGTIPHPTTMFIV